MKPRRDKEMSVLKDVYGDWNKRTTIKMSFGDLEMRIPGSTEQKEYSIAHDKDKGTYGVACLIKEFCTNEKLRNADVLELADDLEKECPVSDSTKVMEWWASTFGVTKQDIEAKVDFHQRR